MFSKSKSTNELIAQISTLQQSNSELNLILSQAKEEVREAEGKTNIAQRERDQMEVSFKNEAKNREEIENQRNTLVKERDELKGYLLSGNQHLHDEINYLKFHSQQLSELHDEVVRKQWEHDDTMKQWSCKIPFERIEINENGDVYTCCSAFVKHGHLIGNAYRNDLEDVWNSDNAKKLRYAVAEGNFEYCNDLCQYLNSVNTNKFVLDSPIVKREDIKYKYTKWQDCSLSTPPLEISLICDYTCNLSCTSCRSHVRVNNADKNEHLSEMLERFVRPAMNKCERITALGSGEFFASKPLQEFFKTITKEEFPDLKVTIVTNGTLLTPKNFEKFPNLNGMIQCIKVSMDAAQKETYEKLRRGGKWETLLENMKYLSSLRQAGKVQKTVINFVVQSENYLQMPEFVELAHNLGVDIVNFQRLSNWGTFREEDFIKQDVFHPQNPHREEAVAILKDIISNEKDVAISENILSDMHK
jgi:radical SAM protein with 4Fe4S-binding SPASM domain